MGFKFKVLQSNHPLIHYYLIIIMTYDVVHGYSQVTLIFPRFGLTITTIYET